MADGATRHPYPRGHEGHGAGHRVSAVAWIRSRQASMSSQRAGMPDNPYAAPAIWPYTAPVVSASSPRLTAASEPSSKELDRQNAHSAASSEAITWPVP